MADRERTARVARAVQEVGMDAVMCALPMNVLMLSGYWPVVGTAIALCTCEGEVKVAAPEAEKEFALLGGPDVLETFTPGSLESMDPEHGTRDAVNNLLQTLPRHARVGIETEAATVPVGYSALHIYKESLQGLLQGIRASLACQPFDRELARLRAVKTSQELQRLRLACTAAQPGFLRAAAMIKEGARELDVALAARQEFCLPEANEGAHRADGFAWCMAGENSAEAGAAFARSQSRRVRAADAVLLHANTYLDGYWTDITRTFEAGESNGEVNGVKKVVVEARAAALAAIKPGVRASAVDAAARQVITAHSYGDCFSHGLGHEVGFGAINANDMPRLHPQSPDVLEAGMTFNVEPAVYLPGKFGFRHCDVVAVTPQGCEVLTPWLALE